MKWREIELEDESAERFKRPSAAVVVVAKQNEQRTLCGTAFAIARSTGGEFLILVTAAHVMVEAVKDALGENYPPRKLFAPIDEHHGSLDKNSPDAVNHGISSGLSDQALEEARASDRISVELLASKIVPCHLFLITGRTLGVRKEPEASAFSISWWRVRICASRIPNLVFFIVAILI
jgi:hypothetical protein